MSVSFSPIKVRLLSRFDCGRGRGEPEFRIIGSAGDGE